MKAGDYAARTAEFIRSFIGKEGCLLLKTEFVTEDGLRYLRAYIDLTDEERKKREEELNRQKAERAAEKEEEGAAAPEGDPAEDEIPSPEVSISDCANISRRVSKWLDKEDFIEEEYTLEVCSKGYLKEEGEN